MPQLHPTPADLADIDRTPVPHQKLHDEISALVLRNRLGKEEAVEILSGVDAYLVFLDGLRNRGVTNMFGVRPYLVETFALPTSVVGLVLSYWMTSYGERHR